MWRGQKVFFYIYFNRLAKQWNYLTLIIFFSGFPPEAFGGSSSLNPNCFCWICCGMFTLYTTCLYCPSLWILHSDDVSQVALLIFIFFITWWMGLLQASYMKVQNYSTDCSNIFVTCIINAILSSINMLYICT